MPTLFLRKVWIMLFLLCSSTIAFAQKPPQPPIGVARTYMANAQYDSAIAVYKFIYESAPYQKPVYVEFLAALMQLQRYADAQSLVTYMQDIRKNDPDILLDQADIYTATKEKKKAEQIYDGLITALPQQEFEQKKLINALNDRKLYAQTLRVYMRMNELRPGAFLMETAKLLMQMGRDEDAMKLYIQQLAMRPDQTEELQTELLAFIEKDPANYKTIEKALMQRVKKDRDDPASSAMLTWLYTTQGQYTAALEHLKKASKTNERAGYQLLSFADRAIEAGEPDQAAAAYDFLVAEGSSTPFYQRAALGRISTAYYQLQQRRPVDAALAAKAGKLLEDFLIEFPAYGYRGLYLSQAEILARYQNKIPSAITLLQGEVDSTGAPMEFVARAKLAIGDYQLLQGNIWEANLSYAQVDKMYKQDALGELARYKAARLAYFRGDFEWAQTQLNVLKASTTQLISNDAMQLSIVIIENLPKDDTNSVPLQKFATAEMLLSENKLDSATALLQSIGTTYPKTELQDDILMLRAKIATELGQFAIAAGLYQEVVEKYGDDVLGDDALLQLADLYRHKLRDNAKAATFYEQLVLKYPNSIYALEARKAYETLKSKGL